MATEARIWRSIREEGFAKQSNPLTAARSNEIQGKVSKSTSTLEETSPSPKNEVKSIRFIVMGKTGEMLTKGRINKHRAAAR